MRFNAGPRLLLAGAILLAGACAPVEDPTTLVEDPTHPAPTRTAAPGDPELAPGEVATVVRILDGDTFDARLADGRIQRVRPPQFDTPERGECWHEEATALLEQRIGGQDVRLIPLADGSGRDRRGRLLRTVEVDGRDVGEQMLLAGAARWLDRYAHEDARLAATYEAAEHKARQTGAGAWTACPDWS